MKVYRYEDSLADIVNSKVRTVFFAGPTVRGHQSHLTSWRPEAIAEFERQGFDGDVILPEFTAPRGQRHSTVSDKGKLWIPAWEYAGLSGCDVIMFWVPRTRELIGLTTNHEHGFWLAKNALKCVYGRPDDAYRMTYLDLMWEWFANKPFYTTLTDTVQASIMMATYDGNSRIKSTIPVDSPYGAF